MVREDGVAGAAALTAVYAKLNFQKRWAKRHGWEWYLRMIAEGGGS